MRVVEEYVRSGYFWLPGREDEKVPGTLKISDGGKIELEIIGLLDATLESLSKSHDFRRIIGNVEKDGFVTLEQSFYRTKNFAFGAVAKSVLAANRAIVGVAYDDDEHPTFNTFRFSVDGLDDWLEISGIGVSYSADFRTATISYIPQPEISYDLDDGFSLHILFGYTLPGKLKHTEAKITQTAFLELRSNTPRRFSEFARLQQKIAYLLCLAMDATVSVKNVSATSNDIVHELSGDKSRPVRMSLYYGATSFSAELPRIDVDRMLFRFSHIKDSAKRVLNNWLDAYEVMGPALQLYFSAAAGTHQYLDGRFLALAQALETYHRRSSSETLMDPREYRSLFVGLLRRCDRENRKWLRTKLMYGNEISLGQRIKRIVHPYKSYLGNNSDRERLVRSIVDTRNYLTHFNEDLRDRTSSGVELWSLCQKMEAIFQLHLLQQLGFSKEEMGEILSKNYKLKDKFKIHRDPDEDDW